MDDLLFQVTNSRISAKIWTWARWHRRIRKSIRARIPFSLTNFQTFSAALNLFFTTIISQLFSPEIFPRSWLVRWQNSSPESLIHSETAEKDDKEEWERVEILPRRIDQHQIDIQHININISSTNNWNFKYLKLLFHIRLLRHRRRFSTSLSPQQRAVEKFDGAAGREGNLFFKHANMRARKERQVDKSTILREIIESIYV